MKKCILILILSILGQAAHSTEISYIKDRDSNRILVYSQENNELVFTLLNGSMQLELKRIPYSISSNSLRISGSHNDYDFKVIKEFMGLMADASGSAYDWCWTPMGDPNSDTRGNVSPAFSGAYLAVVGVVASASLCAVTPAIPAVVGALIVPIVAFGNGAYNLGGKIVESFNPDNIAARKFKKLMHAKNRKVSSAVFDSLVTQIGKL